MVDTILWLVGLAIWSWLVLGGLFFAYPTVVRLKDRRDEFSWIVLVPVFCLLLVGVIADIIYNSTCGVWIFKEPPKHELRREFPFIKFELFTDRLKRHLYGSDKKQKERCRKWVRWVNIIDPGHV